MQNKNKNECVSTVILFTDLSLYPESERASHFRFSKKSGKSIRKELSIRGVPSDGSFDEICDIYKSLIPSIEYQKENLLWRARQSKEFNKYLADYINYGSESINEMLRRGESDRASIEFNETLLKAPGVDKDLFLYRVTSEFPMPDIGGRFTSLGFMSTSISSNMVVNNDREYILKIFVPKGSPMIWYPSHEKEYLLPHGMIFEVVDKKKVLYNTRKKGDVTKTLVELKLISIKE